MMPPRKLLFICTQNRMRSLTAESMYEGFSRYEVKSAGTDSSARTPLTRAHVEWADMIFVMEEGHLRFLNESYGRALDGKVTVCLNIADIYVYMEPDLIEELKRKLREHVAVPE